MMHIINRTKIVLIALSGLLFGTACGDMHETYQEFLDGGERVYVGKADSLSVHPGKNRLQLQWLALSDPYISHAKVYWNNRTDSVAVDITKTENVDTVRVMLEDLAEGDYSFEIITYDDRGNTSVTMQTVGKVYGDNYAATLVDRPITEYEMLTDTIVLYWGAARPEAFATEIRFADDGAEQILQVPVSNDTTKIALEDINSSLESRTLFLPDSLAIDTFYTEFAPLTGFEPPEEMEISALSVQGTQLMNANGEPVVLRGVSYGHHNWWGRFYNEGTVAWLKEDFNAKVVRAAIGVEASGGYLSDPETAYEALYKVVDAAIANNLYVLVDWHSHEIHLEEAKDFFRTVATKYAGVPNVLYEVFNEPVAQTWPEIKAYAEEIIDVIREHGDNVIIVGTRHYDSYVQEAADDPITGEENIMYTMHFYAATGKYAQRNWANEALSKGLPLFVTECGGMESSGDGPIDIQSWNTWVSWLNTNQVSHIMWSIGDKNTTASMISGNGSSTGGWDPNAHINEWGRMVRNYLRGQ